MDCSSYIVTGGDCTLGSLRNDVSGVDVAGEDVVAVEGGNVTERKRDCWD
jgi:hypothetical protein